MAIESHLLRFSLVGGWSKVQILDYVGLRYIPEKKESHHIKLVNMGAAIPAGCSMTTMEPILLRNNPIRKDSKSVTRDRLAANRALMGDGTLIKLTVWNGQYNRTIIPTASLLRDGVLGNLKQLLSVHRIRGMHISNAEKDAMVKCVTLGMPLVIPKAALLGGRDLTASGEYRLGNIIYPVARPFF
jgi:hypothetical protein